MVRLIANILIIRFDGIGDATILAPLIAGLRTARHRLDILLSERNHAVFATGVFDRIFQVPWNAWKTRCVERTFATLITTLRGRAYDWALIPTEEAAAYRLARAVGIPNRRGFENGWEKPLKTHWVRSLCTSTIYRPASLRDSEHEANVQFRLGKGLGTPNQPSRDLALLRPLFLTNSEAPASATFSALPSNASIALQITPKWKSLGVSSQALSKLSAALHRRTRNVHFFTPRSDEKLARTIAGNQAISLHLFDDLSPWKQAIARASLLITPDTGAAHLAGMLGTPTIDCFPAKDFARQAVRWSPWATRSKLVSIIPDDDIAITRILAATQAFF